jgi:hypothetical protein
VRAGAGIDDLVHERGRLAIGGEVDDVEPSVVDHRRVHRVVPDRRVVDVTARIGADDVRAQRVVGDVEDDGPLVVAGLDVRAVNVEPLPFLRDRMSGGEDRLVALDECGAVWKVAKVDDLEARASLAHHVGVLVVGLHLAPAVRRAGDEGDLTDRLCRNVDDVRAGIAAEERVLAAVGRGVAPERGVAPAAVRLRVEGIEERGVVGRDLLSENRGRSEHEDAGRKDRCHQGYGPPAVE